MNTWRNMLKMFQIWANGRRLSLDKAIPWTASTSERSKIARRMTYIQWIWLHACKLSWEIVELNLELYVTGLVCNEVFKWNNFHCSESNSSKLKVVFFSESEIRFSNLQKILFQITIFNKLFTVMGGNFKFQVQDSDLE